MSSSPNSSRFKMKVSVDDRFIQDILLLGGVFGRRIKCLNFQTHERANFHRKKANPIITPHSEVEECLPQDFQPVPIDIHAEDTDSIEDISFDCCNSVNMGNPLSFLNLLQHFAVHTRQKLEHMNYLLKLLKRYQPDPCYDSLPMQVRQPVKDKTNQSVTYHKLWKLVVHSDLLQYVSIYKEDSTLLPTCIRTKVESLDSRLHKSNVKRGLLCGNLERAQSMPSTVEKSFHGTSKPNIKKFLRALISELKRLHSKNRNTSETSGRQFTVSLRCIIADTPMRSYLKRIISCNGYWACERCVQMGIPKRFKGRKKAFIELRDLNAPKRLDCNFLSYTKSDKSNDNHLLNVNDLSPFMTKPIDLPMVTGFILDPMKCTPWEYGGSQVRSLSECGNSYKIHELRRFAYVLLFPVFQGLMVDSDLEHIMMIPYFMLLLGAFNPNPVAIQNIERQELLLKNDVEKYKVGVECLSAFVYENFQGYFRHFLASGNLPVEQFRNRLIERSLYLLPTPADGLILNSDESFEIEASKSVAGNQYPNNVCMLRNGSIIIVKDIVELPTGSGTYTLVGVKFRTLENAFIKPYVSSHFKTYLASNVSSIDEWDFTSIQGKMEAILINLSLQRMLNSL
uniref:Uncharacterized protein n=1 Tax=Daphnia galeata TaxID=27404 RepID=A0A8J2RJ64_9CRUS|nr:unnamed protein product [Daphnia galeata]